MQIAENEQFTAINALQIKGLRINNAFKINNNTGLFCKYASDTNDGGEYVFTFTTEHLDAVLSMDETNDSSFLALVCVEAAEICCLTVAQFNGLITDRKKSAKKDENSYQILVTAKAGNSMRAYVNAAGKKNTTTGTTVVVPRNAFPNSLFS